MAITLPGEGAEVETADAPDVGERQSIELAEIRSGVVLPAGTNFIGKTAAGATVASANFTRPSDTNAYTSGDLVANNTSAGSVVPMSFTVARAVDAPVEISAARIKKTSTVLTNASFRVHLYRSDPSAATGITNGDNGAWLTKEAGYIGCIDVTIDKAFSDSSKGFAQLATPLIALPTSGAQTIFGLLEARAAYGPASAEVFQVELEDTQH